MSSWVYGFVEVSEFDEEAYDSYKKTGERVKVSDCVVKKLVLSEVYFKDGKPFLWTPLNWSDVSEADKKILLTDLIEQVTTLKKSFWFRESDFK